MFTNSMKFILNRNWQYLTSTTLEDLTIETVLLDISSNVGVELLLFPLMTCKTRLQSKKGFIESGGFRNLHNGITTAFIFDIPYGVMFAFVYEYVKHNKFIERILNGDDFRKEIFACCVADVASTIVTVPRDLVLQQQQVSDDKLSAVDILWQTYRTDGLLNGIYCGYSATIVRNIPYITIEYFLWEHISYDNGSESNFTWSNCFATLGFIILSNVILSIIVTPVDVAKTRIQLKQSNGIVNPCSVIHSIYQENGLMNVFAGLIARIIYQLCGNTIVFLVFMVL